MINNPVRNIHTDYVANDVFKPKDANALAMSIPFDFVITKERVDEYRESRGYTQSDWMDVGDLLWEDTDVPPDYTCGGRTAVHILINFHTSTDDKFNFGGRLTQLTVEEVHIHSLSSYRACGTSLNIFYHTHGSENFVLFDGDNGPLYRDAPLHVGSFVLWYSDGEGYPQWHSDSPFIYEQCVEGPLPVGSAGEPGVVVKQENWLSNGVGNGGKNVGNGTRAVAVLLRYDLIGPGPTVDGTEPVPSQRLPIQKVLYHAESGNAEWKVVSRSKLPEVGTAVGVQTDSAALVYRETSGTTSLLPNPLFGSDFMEFKNLNGAWVAPGSGSWGIVLSDSFLNCTPSVYPSLDTKNVSSVSVREGTTQLDIYTTVGYRIQDLDTKFPADNYFLFLDDLENIGEGTVVELNIYIVGLPVAKVNCKAQIQHLFGDWEASTRYNKGAMCLTSSGGTSPTYTAWEWVGDGGISNVNPTGGDNRWKKWEGTSNSHNWRFSPELFPAIPGDGSSGDICLYFRDSNTGNPLDIYAWGYGQTGDLVQGGRPIQQSNSTYIYPTFEQPYAARSHNVPGYTNSPFSIPIIGSSRIVFTRLRQNINNEEKTIIVLLNGGYNTARPAKRNDRVPI